MEFQYQTDKVLETLSVLKGLVKGITIFACMLQSFLNRPIAEDFSFKSQVWQSLQAGLYVFLFVYFFAGSSFSGSSRVMLLAMFGAGCSLSTLFANWVVPQLLPKIYDEDRWTVWKYILQTLFVLFCISVGNQTLLILTDNEYPVFWQMYLTVTIIGFFPITISVFITEQRRLKRNLANAYALNEHLTHRIEPAVATSVSSEPIDINKPTAVSEKPIVLLSETGKERLSLQPAQLLYVESVGNYVEVHWLNMTQPQKILLRNTLKNVADVLSPHPQFFRCHRAFLVNLKVVSQTEGNARGYQLTLTGTETAIPVSRSYLDAFDERINALL